MKREKIQVATHAFCLLSVFWTIFSLLAIFDVLDARRFQKPLDANALPALAIWALHLIFISCALLFKRAERARETWVVGEEAVSKFLFHLGIGALLANIPLFAKWHGDEFALHLLIHLAMVSLGIALVFAPRYFRHWKQKSVAPKPLSNPALREESPFDGPLQRP